MPRPDRSTTLSRPRKSGVQSCPSNASEPSSPASDRRPSTWCQGTWVSWNGSRSRAQLCCCCCCHCCYCGWQTLCNIVLCEDDTPVPFPWTIIKDIVLRIWSWGIPSLCHHAVSVVMHKGNWRAARVVHEFRLSLWSLFSALWRSSGQCFCVLAVHFRTLVWNIVILNDILLYDPCQDKKVDFTHFVFYKSIQVTRLTDAVISMRYKKSEQIDIQQFKIL